jgi:HPt (histidine-containing phosphotransfer) domain-containing protein
MERIAGLDGGGGTGILRVMDSTPPPSPAMILASLCGRLQGLLRAAPDQATRDELAAALGEVRDLSRMLGTPQGGWSVDARAFDRLMDLAGALSGDLLVQLRKDLQDARQRLGRAIPRCDWGDLRAATHTLVALAGSVGAERLHRLSGALNAVAHRQDGGALADLGSDVLAGLDHLIAFISDRIAAVPAGRAAGSGER